MLCGATCQLWLPLMLEAPRPPIIAADVASAVLHSGKSLKHVGKPDKHPKLGRKVLDVEHSRRSTSQYHTNSTARQLHDLILEYSTHK
jgi:hypothetical protein